AEVRRRRQRCAIPEQVRHRQKWLLALDMLDEITDISPAITASPRANGCSTTLASRTRSSRSEPA
ncbi:MAG: hypothetical protein ABIQ18_41045, partial [Umezawaea sp.]